MNKPIVSVIIPLLEINDYIRYENLPAHKKLNPKNFEVIILPNELPDDDKKLLKKYPWLRIIPTHNITRPAQKRDFGARKSHGKILAFIDDDAFPTKNWLHEALPLFDKKNADVICGPGILPPHVSKWEHVFDEILKTWVGNADLTMRVTPKKERYVDDYPSMNFLMKKNVFLKLGGFNSDYWPGEDSKLCEDLVYSLHGNIFYSPKVVVYHHRRNSLIPYLKQHGQYGFHRGAFFAHGDKNSRHIYYLAPAGLIFYVILLLILLLLFHGSLLVWLFSIPLAVYGFLLLTLFISSFKNTHNLQITFLSVIVLLLMHMVYGVQFIKGLCIGFIHKNNIYGKKTSQR